VEVLSGGIAGRARDADDRIVVDGGALFGEGLAEVAVEGGPAIAAVHEDVVAVRARVAGFGDGAGTGGIDWGMAEALEGEVDAAMDAARAPVGRPVAVGGAAPFAEGHGETAGRGCGLGGVRELGRVRPEDRALIRIDGAAHE